MGLITRSINVENKKAESKNVKFKNTKKRFGLVYSARHLI
jgi:hypothetical protein